MSGKKKAKLDFACIDNDFFQLVIVAEGGNAKRLCRVGKGYSLNVVISKAAVADCNEAFEFYRFNFTVVEGFLSHELNVLQARYRGEVGTAVERAATDGFNGGRKNDFL